MTRKFHRRFYAQPGEFLQDVHYIMSRRGIIRRAMRELVSPAYRERLMMVVTEVNGCRYCSYYHSRLARAIAPDAQIDIIGIRPGEKLHEDLLSEDEARNAVERETMFIIKPPETLWKRDMHYEGKPLPEGFSYTSDNNAEWLDLDGIKKYIAPFEALYTQGKLEG